MDMLSYLVLFTGIYTLTTYLLDKFVFSRYGVDDEEWGPAFGCCLFFGGLSLVGAVLCVIVGSMYIFGRM